MRKNIIKSDIVLFLLILIFVSIIFLFVDFSSKEKKDYNISVYKSYYVYDKLSNPISLSYDMININKNEKKDVIIKKVFDKNKLELKLNEIIINNDEVTLLVDKSINNYDKLDIECLANSILEINNYKLVNFKYNDESNSYNSTTDKYYINSPIINKLYTFLYRDKNYKIIYDDNIKLTIKTSKDDYVIYNILDEEEKWAVKKDGLYKNDHLILPLSFKVGYVTSNVKVISINLDTDNTLLINIEVINDDIFSNYVLKQGLGIYSLIEKDAKGNIIKNYKYVSKEFNEG